MIWNMLRRSFGRRPFSTGSLLAIALGMTATPDAPAQWRNALKPEGTPGPAFTLVTDGKPVAGIQLPSNPTGPEQKAAADLQEWVRQITGATLPISQRHTGAVITLRTDPALGDEGYSIDAEQNRLSLSGGKTRGVPNAVYALLEEDLGCRFYTAESVLLPGTNTLTVAAVPRRYIPVLKIRDPFYASAFNSDWSLRNRSNAPDAPVPEAHGGHMDYGGMFVHTADRLVPAGKYMAGHPEYFAQKPDGTRSAAQLCATHPDVARIAIEHVQKVLKDKPHTEILSISKNDNMEVCHCERCVKLRETEGSDMANQLFLVNKVAEAVEKDHPNLVIDTLAYLETIQVPKTVRPRKNVVIRLCNDSVGSWSRPFTPAGELPVAAIARAWAAAHNRIHIWDYNVNFSHYLAPMPNIDIMAANIRFWISNNAEGVMLQGGYQGPAERDELKSWVTAKLLWNPAWDETALTRDFIWGYYGKAAPALQAYEELLNDLRATYAKEMANPPGGIRYPMDAPFITKEFIDQASGLFDHAKGLAEDDERLTRRIDRARLPILYVQCVRGPTFAGADYPNVVAEFERIARAENVRFLQEGGPDFEQKLAGFKSKIVSEPCSASSVVSEQGAGGGALIGDNTDPVRAERVRKTMLDALAGGHIEITICQPVACARDVRLNAHPDRAGARMR
jgi:hypothetical protein